MEVSKVPRLRLVPSGEDSDRFQEMLDAVAGIRKVASSKGARFAPIVAMLLRLEERIEAVEAELVPRHRSRKCPCCHRLSLSVVATRPHPEFGPEGIEQHDVECSCGYQTTRLHDPSGLLR
jgi:hypothetical protein